MATINHVSGKSYRVCTNADTDTYDELSFKTDSTDVKFNDGYSAEYKVGIINGITDDLSCEDSSIAASSAAVKTLNDSLGGLRFGKDGDGNYGYYGADDSLIPFKHAGYDVNTFTVGGGDFKSAYPCQAYNTLKVTTSGGNPQLSIYGVSSIASTSGTLLKTITSNTTVSIDVSNYDYVYLHQNSSQYLTINITFE